jgi:hypothetical protein
MMRIFENEIVRNELHGGSKKGVLKNALYIHKIAILNCSILITLIMNVLMFLKNEPH